MADAMACRPAFGIGDALDRQRRVLGRQRVLGQCLNARHRRVVDFDFRNVGGDLVGCGQPHIGILRRHLCHGDGPLG